MLYLIAVKTNTKTYFAEEHNVENGSYYNSPLQEYYFNGIQPKKSFQRGWYYVDGNIERVEKKVQPSQINKRFVLVDESLCSDKIPLEISYDVRYYDEYSESYKWKEPFRNLESLYVLKWDDKDEGFEIIEFSLNVVLELDENDLKLPIYPSYKEKIYGNLYDKEIERKHIPQHEILSKIMFPSIVEHLTPCKYTSKQVYEIVREYVKRNYNPEFCEISSDYDFCFQVNKKIPLPNTKEWQKEIYKTNGTSFKHRKYETRYTNHRTVPVFEMTHAEDKYKGYTPIPEIFGNTEQDLIDKVNILCEEIVVKINEPLVECVCCKGLGVILDENKL